MPDGRVRHLTSTSEGKLDNKGNLIQIFGIVKDISDHKEVEERLRKSEAKFRDLIENINDVIYSTNENGEIIYISPSIKGVMGYDPSGINEPLHECRACHAGKRRHALENTGSNF